MYLGKKAGTVTYVDANKIQVTADDGEIDTYTLIKLGDQIKAQLYINVLLLEKEM